MSKTSHTPTPWKVVSGTEHHGPYIETQHGRTIADLYFMGGPSAGDPKPVWHMDDEAEANAAFIVRAVNAYQPMLEALKEADEALKAVHEYFEVRKTLTLALPSEAQHAGGLTDEPAFGTDALMQQVQKRGES